MQRLSTKISRSTRKLDRFDLSSIEEIFLLFRKLPVQDGTSTRRSYPFLSRVFFAEGAESRLMESTEVGPPRGPKREEDRFPALISLRAAFSFGSFLFFAL